MGGIYGCGCKEVYRFPHNINYPSAANLQVTHLRTDQLFLRILLQICVLLLMTTCK